MANGRIPPLDDGASAIHSADDRCARFTLEDVLKECPVVVSVMVTVKDRPANDASADMWSPGLIAKLLIRTDACGKNSYQA